MSTQNDLAAIMQQGAAPEKKQPVDQKFAKDDLLKKYFTPRVPDGATEARFDVRILRNPEGGSPFKEVKFHNIKIGKSWTKLLCLKEHDEDCPLCDTADGLFQAGDKEEAKKYRPHTFYIVRVIDRANEAHGVKFWRFKKNWKGNGEFDKISAKVKLGFNIIDEENGFDLVITSGLDDRKNSGVKDISCITPSKLSQDAAQAEAWINDDTTWKDIYKPKTAEYLTDVVHGRAQYWDQDLKKYVTPGKVETTEEKSETSSTTVNDGAKTNPLLKGEKIEEDDILNSSVEDEDLPF